MRTFSVIAVGDQRIESLNYQLGVLEAGGADWTYVDGARVNGENVQLLFPGFPRGYQFPRSTGSASDVVFEGMFVGGEALV